MKQPQPEEYARKRKLDKRSGKKFTKKVTQK